MTPDAGEHWSSDVPVSMPMPPVQARMVPMGGFVMTPGGLAHDISEVDYIQLSIPTYTPKDFNLDPVYEDQDVEAPSTWETF
jgi:hypothetical protein